VTMTLSHLSPEKQYTVVLWSTRGGVGSDYSNRWTDIVIASVDSFVNNSAAESVKMTSVVADDMTRVHAENLGHVAKYDAIRPGADGTIVFTLTANGTNGALRAYLNAFVIQASPVGGPANPDSDGDGMPDAWELLYFGDPTNGVAGAHGDSDGASNLEEYYAGTNPTNPASVLKATIVGKGGGAAQVVVAYPTVQAAGDGYSGLTRTYDLEADSNLATGSWQGVAGATNIPGSDSTAAYTNALPGNVDMFRVKAKLQ
jgi:hypothetical protein